MLEGTIFYFGFCGAFGDFPGLSAAIGKIAVGKGSKSAAGKIMKPVQLAGVNVVQTLSNQAAREAADGAIMGDKSRRALRRWELMERGYTEEDAQKILIEQDIRAMASIAPIVAGGVQYGAARAIGEASDIDDIVQRHEYGDDADPSFADTDMALAEILQEDAPRKPFTDEVDSGIVEENKLVDSAPNLESQQNIPPGNINSNSTHLLPNYDKAVIPMEKLAGYALNPDHSTGKNKARVFESALGYNASNADHLLQNIKDNLYRFEAIEKPDLGYGQLYQVDMELTGPNGNTAIVRTAWILDKDTGETRLTSTYVLN